MFLNNTFTVFLDWQKPVSTVANPKCMINTNAVDNIIQMLLAVNKFMSTFSASSARVGAAPSSCTTASNAAEKFTPLTTLVRFPSTSVIKFSINSLLVKQIFD